MSHIVEDLLRNRAVSAIARVLLTFPFWGSGLAKLIAFENGVAEMAHFGLQPAVLFNIATIAVQLGASLLIVLNRFTWLGAGALAVFTALTIPIAHPFWSMTEEPFRTIALHTASEHVGMIGALVVVAILAAHRSGSTESSSYGQRPARGVDPLRRV